MLIWRETCLSFEVDLAQWGKDPQNIFLIELFTTIALFSYKHLNWVRLSEYVQSVQD